MHPKFHLCHLTEAHSWENTSAEGSSLLHQTGEHSMCSGYSKPCIISAHPGHSRLSSLSFSLTEKLCVFKGSHSMFRYTYTLCNVQTQGNMSTSLKNCHFLPLFFAHSVTICVAHGPCPGQGYSGGGRHHPTLKELVLSCRDLYSHRWNSTFRSTEMH